MPMLLCRARRNAAVWILAAGTVFLVEPMPVHAGVADRTLVAGQDGWSHEIDSWQGILRANLTDPDVPVQRSAGVLLLTCSRAGYKIHFSLDRAMRLRMGGGAEDGFAHFVPDNDGTGVSIYVAFSGAASFHSARSAILGDPGAVPALVDLLRSARRIVTLVLSPRAPGDRFRRDARVRLVVDPGRGELSKDEAMSRFAEDCRGRVRTR